MILTLYFSHTRTYKESIAEFAVDKLIEDMKAVQEWQQLEDPLHITTYPFVKPIFFVFPVDVTALSSYLLGKLNIVTELAHKHELGTSFPYGEMGRSQPKYCKVFERISLVPSRGVSLRDSKRGVFRGLFYVQTVDRV